MDVLLALVLLQASTSAQPIATEDTIVVTGTLPSLRDALEHCKKGGCTPRQDIVASIRYAEAIFRGGHYLEARRVLQDAVARDKKAARSDPVAVAALYEATATAAAHDGEQKVVVSATNARAQVLREVLPRDSLAVLRADLDVIDMRLHAGRTEEAKEQYRGLARRAEAAGQPNLLADILIRQAIVEHAQRRDTAAGDLLNHVIGNEAVAPAYRLAARATAARFARERGDRSATDSLIASLTGRGQPGPPLLLWQPPLPAPSDPAHLNYYNLTDTVTRSSDVMPARWVDIGFLIKPDGTVDTPEVLRAGGAPSWAGPIVSAIARRRYAPPGEASGNALYRIERWTLTGDYDTPTGSLIRRRAGNPHFEQVDLTPAEPQAKTHG